MIQHTGKNIEHRAATKQEIVIMKKAQKTSETKTMRQKAEDLLKKKQSKSTQLLSEADTLKLIHELEVHQIELEMQNEELKLAKESAEIASENYIELYDFAPSGFFTISKTGKILELNFSGATMLGRERSLLIKSDFDVFVSQETKPIFNQFFKNVFISKVKETCELSLTNKGNKIIHVLLSGTSSSNAERCYITAIDISVKVKAEEAIRNSEFHYRTLFENSPVPLWEEDLSEAKKKIDALKRKGVNDFRKYFEENPELLMEFVQMIKILEVNKPAIELHEATSKDELIQGLSSVFKENSFNNLKEILIAIAEERTNFEFDGDVKTLNGKEKYIHLKWTVVPGYEETMEKVFISTIDISERIMAKEALKHQVEFNEIMLQSMMDGYVLTNAEGNIIEVNQSYCRMVQYTREELLQMNVYDLDVHFDQKEITERTKRFKRDGKAKFETKQKCKNGSFVDFEVSASIVKMPEGGFAASFLRDITERKKTEKALQSSELYYRVLFENSPVPLWEEDFSDIKIDIDKLKKNGIKDFRKYFDENPHLISGYIQKVKILEVNNAVLALHGANSKDELMDGLNLIFTQSSLEGFTNNLIAIAEGNKSAEFDGIVKKLNGKEISINVIWVLVPGFEDSMQKVFVSTIDISERKMAKEALKEQVQFNEQILHTTMDGFILADPDGKIIEVNPSYCQMTGYTYEELLSMNIKNVEVKLAPDEIDRRVKKMIADGRDQFESKHRTKDGKNIDLSVSIVITFKNEKPLVAAFVRDITEQKKAQLLLEGNEQKLRNIFENSTNLFYTHTTDHKITYLSPQVKEVLGYTEEEALINWMNMATDNPINELGYQYTQKAIETGQKQLPYMLELVKKNGNKIWVEVREAPIVKNGKTISIVGALTDITDRVNAENEIIEREHLLSESQKVAKLGSYNLDFSTGFWESSEILRDLFGINNDYKTDVKGWIDLVHPDDKKMMQTYFSVNILEKFEHFNKEYRIIRPNDKKECWVHGLGRLELNEDGLPAKMIGTIQDITGRKLFDETLKENEIKYRSLIENSNDAIYLLYNNKFEVINNKFTEMLGYTKEEINMPGFGYEFLVAPVSKHVFINRREQFEKGEIEANKYEIKLLTKDGKEIDVEISDSFINYKDGIANQGFIRDITARKKQQEILMNATVKVQEDEKYNFGKELHDGLGQVLISASMYLESLGKTKDSLDDNKKKDLEQAQKLNKQAINDARRISHGLMITGIDEHGLIYLIKQLCYNSGGPEINFRLTQKNIDEERISSEYKIHIYRIVQELSTNILKHSEATKAQISIAIKNENTLKLTVSDNGNGFDQAKTGIGAGLSNIDQRITIMKGKKEIESVKGKGTKIIISIPLF